MCSLPHNHRKGGGLSPPFPPKWAVTSVGVPQAPCCAREALNSPQISIRASISVLALSMLLHILMASKLVPRKCCIIKPGHPKPPPRCTPTSATHLPCFRGRTVNVLSICLSINFFASFFFFPSLIIRMFGATTRVELENHLLRSFTFRRQVPSVHCGNRSATCVCLISVNSFFFA